MDSKCRWNPFLAYKKQVCPVKKKISPTVDWRLKSENIFSLISGEDDKTFPNRLWMSLYADKCYQRWMIYKFKKPYHIIIPLPLDSVSLFMQLLLFIDQRHHRKKRFIWEKKHIWNNSTDAVLKHILIKLSEFMSWQVSFTEETSVKG